MVLVVSADDRFVLGLAVTVFSALSNLSSSEDVILYLLDVGMKAGDRGILERMVLSLSHLNVHVKWITVDPHSPPLGDLFTTEWYSTAVYARLLLPELVPEEDQRAIYLDTDLLVQRDLRALWDRNCNGYCLAVRDYKVPSFGAASKNHEFEMLNCLPETPYFNTGVMLLDLHKWRKDNVGQRAIEYCRKFRPTFHDQDGINAVIEGGWERLDPRWNVMLNAMSCCEQQEQQTLLDEACILHFSGPVKPWHYHCDQPIRSRWFDCLKRSGWFEPLDSTRDVMEAAWARQNEYDAGAKELFNRSRELFALMRPGDRFILVDGNMLPWLGWDSHNSIPFLEHNGAYWGNPIDDAAAVRDLERLRRSGAGYIVFTWLAFWWFEYYTGFRAYLDAGFRCILNNDTFAVFDLRAAHPENRL